MKIVKPIVFVFCLTPVAWLVFGFFTNRLGANPISVITNTTGLFTLRFLMVTLLCTPLRKLFGWHFINRYRRMLGLFAFFYGTLHLFTYLWLDQFFAWSDILKDIIKRPFITAGMTAFVCMVPLAITSTRKAIARLGGKRWQQLHRLIYVSAIAGVIHFYWLVKADVREPLFYASIAALLLGIRVWFAVN